MQTSIGILTSVPNRLINKRFMVKVSTLSNEEKIDSILMIVVDVIDGAFGVKHFTKEKSALEFINSLKEIT